MFKPMYVCKDESYATAVSNFLVSTARWQWAKRKVLRIARQELPAGRDGLRAAVPRNSTPASGAVVVGREAFSSVCLLGVVAACNALAADDATTRGRVESFSVGCTGRSAGVASWRPLRKGEPVLAGHQLRCPAGGAVSLRLPGSGAQEQYFFKKTLPVLTVPSAPSNLAEPGTTRGGVQAQNLQPEFPSDGGSLAEQKMLAQATRFTQPKIFALGAGSMIGAMTSALQGRRAAGLAHHQGALVGSAVGETDSYVTAKRAEAQLDETRAQRAVLADAEADLERLSALSESVVAVVSAGRRRLHQLKLNVESGQLSSNEASAGMARESQNINTIQLAYSRAHQTLDVYRDALVRLGAPADLVDSLALVVQQANQSLTAIHAQTAAYKVAFDQAQDAKPPRVPVSSSQAR
jgi:hypothetical protein